MKSEIWKHIDGYGEAYQISDTGIVKSVDRLVWYHTANRFLIRKGNVMKTHVVQGYRCVSLTKNGATKMYKLHRLMAIAFIPNPDNKPFINHKDGDKLNNSLENLEWVTVQENVDHAWDNGLVNIKGENHYNKKLTSQDVISIREVYKSGIYTQIELAALFKVCKSNIQHVISGNSWTHV